MEAVCTALAGGSPVVVRDAGLMAARDLAAAAQPSLFLPSLPVLLPHLLACAAEQEARELAAAADEALEVLLARAPPQSCLGLLVQHLPSAGAPPAMERRRSAHLHAVLRCLRRVVARMQPAGLAAHLQPQLLPGLCATFGSPLADVRKATVDCLVAVWQVCFFFGRDLAGSIAFGQGWQAAHAERSVLTSTTVHHVCCKCMVHSSPRWDGTQPDPPTYPLAHAQVVGDALQPHLEPLSASQLKLLHIYIDKSRPQGARTAA